MIPLGVRTFAASQRSLDAGSNVVTDAGQIEVGLSGYSHVQVLFVADPALTSVPAAQQLAIAYYYQWALPDIEFSEAAPTVDGAVLLPVDVGFGSREEATLWIDPTLPARIVLLSPPTSP